MTKPLPYTLVSDFDGTMTANDFYDLVNERFPEISKQGFWNLYLKGEITHFEALRRIFASIRSDTDTIFDLVSDMKLDPTLKESVNRLHKSGWEVAVASAGCEWYIRILLSKADIQLPTHANPGTFSPEGGLEMAMPKDSPFYSEQMGIDKEKIVREALRSKKLVAFAGDGRTDLVPAMLAPPARRFARGWLARKLNEMGEGFVSFSSWSEIAGALEGKKGLCPAAPDFKSVFERKKNENF